MYIGAIRKELEGRIIYLTENTKCHDSEYLHSYTKIISDVISFYKQFYNLDMFDLFTALISAQKNTYDILKVTGLELKHRSHFEAARILFDRASQLDSSIPNTRVLAADMLRELGFCDEAKAICNNILKEFPRFGEAESCLTMCAADKLLTSHYDYYQLLDYAHKFLKPQSYIEIGVSTGKSIALARKGTVAVGVDPNAANNADHFFHSPEVDPTLISMTSNNFFKSVNLISLFGTSTFDMAFIDGLHVFEQALMDFIHLENISKKDSVIFIHDCLPVNPIVAERVRQTGFWVGDVWRVIPCLKAVRPDLEIVTFPASPSGLAIVTGLDSSSRLLSQQFDAIVAHFLTMSLPESFEERRIMLNVTHIDPVKYMEELFASIDA